MAEQVERQRQKLTAKAHYAWWGDGRDQQAVGLVISAGSRSCFVTGGPIPPAGTLLRLRFALSGVSGTVELKGTVVHPIGESFRGFEVEVAEFLHGETRLRELLGLEPVTPAAPTPASGRPVEVEVEDPGPAASAALDGPAAGGDVESETSRPQRDVTIRLGTRAADEPGFLAGIGVQGLYVKTSPGPDGGWKLRQSLRMELTVNFGKVAGQSYPLHGRIVRVDPPGTDGSRDPSWGLGIRFRGAQPMPPEILARVKVFVENNPHPDLTGDLSSRWDDPHDSGASGVRRGGPIERDKGLLRAGLLSSPSTMLVGIAVLLVLVAFFWWLGVTLLEMILTQTYGPPPTRPPG